MAVIRINIHNIERSLIKSEVDSLRRYLEMLDAQIGREQRQWTSSVEHAAQKIGDPDERDRFYEAYSDEYWQFEGYRRTLRNSFLVATFAYLEDKVGWLCANVQRRVQRDHGIQIGWKDLGGSPLQRAQVYIEKVAGASFPKNDSWAIISSYREIRNQIVHNGGILSKEGNKKLSEFARLKKLVKGHDTRGRGQLLCVPPEACTELLSAIQSFLEELHRSVREGKPSSKSQPARLAAR